MPERISLKIDWDSRDAKKSIMEFSNTAQRVLGKSKLSIVDTETRKVLEGELSKSIQDITDRTKTLGQRAEVYANAIRSGNLSTEKEINSKKQLLKIMNEIVKLENQRNRLQKTVQVAGRDRGVLDKFTEIAQGTAVGGVFGKLGKFLMNPATLGLTLLGAGGLFAFSQMRRGFGQFESTTQERLALRARGVENLTVRDPRFAAVGLNAEDIIRRRRQAMDVFGRAGAMPEAIRRRALFERGMGVEPGAMLQLGERLRPGVGGVEAQKSVLRIQAGTLASGIEDAIGPYLETAANILAEINRNGMGLDEEALSSLNILTRATNGQTERMGKMLINLDTAIKESSGETNALLQTAAMEAGLGGKTIGGIQAVLQAGGLFGVDFAKMAGLDPESRKVLEGLGLGTAGYTAKIARGITSTIDKLVGATPEEMIKLSPREKEALTLKRANIAMGMNLGRGPAQALEATNLMRKLADPTLAKEERVKITKQLTELRGPKPEDSFKNLEKIRDSAEGQLQELKKHTELLRTVAGEKVTGVVGAKRRAELFGVRTMVGAEEGEGVKGVFGGAVPRPGRGVFRVAPPKEEVPPVQKPQVELPAKKEETDNSLKRLIEENFTTPIVAELREITKNTKNQKKSSR